MIEAPQPRKSANTRDAISKKAVRIYKNNSVHEQLRLLAPGCWSTFYWQMVNGSRFRSPHLGSVRDQISLNRGL